MTSKMNYPSLTERRNSTWVQTERAAHEAWGKLTIQSPRAAALMHTIVAHMDHNSAVVCSQATLAKITGMTLATVRRAVADLKEGKWIQVIALGGKGGALAYIVNSRIAWATSRDKLHLSAFSARVIADADEQSIEALTDDTPLKRIPILMKGDLQLPLGPGDKPPSQPALDDSLLPDLPSIDQETGEIL